MLKKYLFILFLISSITVIAQNETDLMYVTIDSITQRSDSTIKNSRFYRPRHLALSEKDAIKMADRMPAFAVYRDTYFVTGIPLNEEITKSTADASFQISIRQRLTRSYLPFKSFLYLTYSQKSFWNIYAQSSPFKDTNYNPGVGLGKYILYKGKVAGAAFVQLKHESNGRDGDDSRSWNYLSLSMKYYFNARFNISGEVWAPYVDGGENKDLLSYRGLGFVSLNYTSYKYRWWLSADINPRKGWGNVNTIITAAFKMSDRSNQYLFARFFQGYGESLLDYNKYAMNIRVGICIKPNFYNFF